MIKQSCIATLATVGLLATTFYATSTSPAMPSNGNATEALTPAHMARTLKATDVAEMRYIKHRSTASHLFEEGAAHGTLPGSMNAYCSLGGTFTASFTIHTNGGTIKGHGTATPHAGGGLYESFAGTLTIDGGTGRYRHAHGHAGLYGTFDRRSYALTVQTTGSLSY